MRLPVNAISGVLDFTIRPTDSTSVQRYKRFLADVHGRFGTLDSGRLVMAIRNEADRKKLRACYHHIRSNHNDASLVFWHGPIATPNAVRLDSGSERWRWEGMVTDGNGGTLLTGDLTCTDKVIERMEKHFGPQFSDSAFLHVPHHGSLHSWNDRLLEGTRREIMCVICAVKHNAYHHPHPQVRGAFARIHGGVRWFPNDERSTVAMRIETI